MILFTAAQFPSVNEVNVSPPSSVSSCSPSINGVSACFPSFAGFQLFSFSYWGWCPFHSSVSSCSPSVIWIYACFLQRFPAVVFQSSAFSFKSVAKVEVDVTKEVRYDLLIYCLLSDIILYFLFVAASSLRAISHELFKRMHVKVILRWWWLRSRQEADYHIWRCVHTPYPHNVLLPLFQFAWMQTLLPTFFFCLLKGV